VSDLDKFTDACDSGCAHAEEISHYNVIARTGAAENLIKPPVRQAIRNHIERKMVDALGFEPRTR
jgi:hypothetical protein